MSVGLEHYLIVGAILFALGLMGFLARRNLIVMFLCAEMMLQGVAINLVAFARFHGNLQGQSFTLFIVTVAACEAGIALALILMLYRRKGALDVSLWQELHEKDWAPAEDDEALPEPPAPEPLPHLTPAGREPARKGGAGGEWAEGLPPGGRQGAGGEWAEGLPPGGRQGAGGGEWAEGLPTSKKGGISHV